MDTANIPNLPEREQRFEEITVDCYDEYEVLSAFEVYLTDALQTPFTGAWGGPPNSRTDRVVVLGVADTDDREGVRLRIRDGNGDEHRVPADQLWADETVGANATVLDDYRAYVADGGLPYGDYEEDDGGEE